MTRRLNVILCLLMDCFKFIEGLVDWLTGVSVGVFNKNQLCVDGLGNSKASPVHVFI